MADLGRRDCLLSFTLSDVRCSTLRPNFAQGAHSWESHPLRWEEDLDATSSSPIPEKGVIGPAGVETRTTAPSMSAETLLGSLGRVNLTQEDEVDRQLVDVRTPDPSCHALCCLLRGARPQIAQLLRCECAGRDCLAGQRGDGERRGDAADEAGVAPVARAADGSAH